MSSGAILADHFVDLSGMKLFQDRLSPCPAMLCPDQEVPFTRWADVGHIKSEIKIEDDVPEEPRYQQQIPNLFAMDEMFAQDNLKQDNNVTSSNHTQAAASLKGVQSWQSSYSGCNTTEMLGNSNVKDTLDTPTPSCNNSLNGLRWDLSSRISSHVSPNSTTQLPQFYSSVQQFDELTSSSSPPTSIPFVTSKQSSSSSSPAPSSVTSSVPSSSASPVPRESPMMSSTALPAFSSFSPSGSQPVLTSAQSPCSVSSEPASISSSQNFLYSSAPSPLTLSPLLNELNSPFLNTPSPGSKTMTQTSTYTNNLAGSGGSATLVSKSNGFSMNKAPQQAPCDSSSIMEYTDLDNQPLSLFDDQEKQKTVNPENSAFIDSNISALMQCGPTVFNSILENWEKNTAKLGIPSDPMQWSADNVQQWVPFICKQSNLPDVSGQLYPLDGPALFNMTDTALKQLGEGGSRIFEEIDFYNGAVEFFSETIPYLDDSCDGSVKQNQQSPSMSPAASYCSNSQGSGGLSSFSDQSDDESVDTGCGLPEKLSTTSSSRSGQVKRRTRPLLWEFLRELLTSGKHLSGDCIRWINHKEGVFKIEDSKRVAELWGERTNHPKMNYDKMSRSIRQYYKKGIIKKTNQSKRLVYQFCEGRY